MLRRSCLELANKQRLENLAFPAISTGVYGYPLREAADVALGAVRDAIGGVSYVEFVLQPESAFNEFVVSADGLLEPIQQAGGAALSEPQQVVPAPADSQGNQRTASLHPSSQAAQPKDSNSQSGMSRLWLCRVCVRVCVRARLCLLFWDWGNIYMRGHGAWEQPAVWLVATCALWPCCGP